MRLWTLHPKYLDRVGLVALWREALLAQAVLLGQTRGYRYHPQLIRFRQSPAPEAAISAYLDGVFKESQARGYSFDGSKIADAGVTERIPVSEGQLDYEWSHLKGKLSRRDPSWLATIQSVARPDPHPLFMIVPGPIAVWEIVGQEASR
jgi:hypothetical protein